jgi:anti-anti-sigma factor
MTLSLFSNLAEGTVPQARIIAIGDELVRGTEVDLLANLLPRVKRESIALDLSAVERIDAAGIAALITLYCTAIEAGTSFSVTSPSPRVLELLSIVGLDPILVAELRAGESETKQVECYTAA